MKEGIAKYTAYRLLQRSENTVVSQNQSLKRFCLYLHNPETDSITLDDVVGYLQGMKELQWNQNSIREQACILRRFFHFNRLMGHSSVPEELIPLPRRAYSKHKTATEEEHQKILAAIPDTNDPRHVRNKALITMLHDTGVRLGELISLQVADLDINRKSCLVKTEKIREAEPWRQAFWTDHAHQPLQAWLEKREYLINTKRMQVYDTEALFFSIAGPTSGHPLSRSGVELVLRSYCRKAGIPKVNPHAYRHKFAHELIQKGGSNSDVSNLLGHSSLASSFVYTKMEGKDLEERYRKFNS